MREEADLPTFDSIKDSLAQDSVIRAAVIRFLARDYPKEYLGSVEMNASEVASVEMNASEVARSAQIDITSKQ